jgi:hypothetical protein
MNPWQSAAMTRPAAKQAQGSANENAANTILSCNPGILQSFPKDRSESSQPVSRHSPYSAASRGPRMNFAAASIPSMNSFDESQNHKSQNQKSQNHRDKTSQMA